MRLHFDVCDFFIFLKIDQMCLCPTPSDSNRAIPSGTLSEPCHSVSDCLDSNERMMPPQSQKNPHHLNDADFMILAYSIVLIFAGLRISNPLS